MVGRVSRLGLGSAACRGSGARPGPARRGISRSSMNLNADIEIEKPRMHPDESHLRPARPLGEARALETTFAIRVHPWLKSRFLGRRIGKGIWGRGMG